MRATGDGDQVGVATGRSSGDMNKSQWIQAVGMSVRRHWRLLGPPIPMITRMIVERFRAATITRSHFATRASPRRHVHDPGEPFPEASGDRASNEARHLRAKGLHRDRPAVKFSAIQGEAAIP